MTPRSMVAAWWTSLGLSAWALAGCGDPRGFEYKTSKPDVSEVTGRYELIEWQSIIPESTEATKDPSASYSLVLNKDGTFSATNVPRFEPPPEGLDVKRLVSASGHWELATVASMNDNDRIWGVRFTSEPKILSAQLMTWHRLVFVLGDPDLGEGLTFHRKD